MRGGRKEEKEQKRKKKKKEERKGKPKGRQAERDILEMRSSFHVCNLMISFV